MLYIGRACALLLDCTGETPFLDIHPGGSKRESGVVSKIAGDLGRVKSIAGVPEHLKIKVCRVGFGGPTYRLTVGRAGRAIVETPSTRSTGRDDLSHAGSGLWPSRAELVMCSAPCPGDHSP